MALLDNFNRNMSQPGQANALGLLGAYLMAAGGPQTDPSAAGRLLAEGTAQYQNALRQSKLDVGNAQMQQLQQDNLQQQISGRQEAAANRAKLTAALQGTPKGAAHDAGVMAVPGGMSNAPTPGLLGDDPVLAAMAGPYPEAAVQGLLEKRALDKRLKSREKIAGLKGTDSALDRKVQALIRSGVDPQRALGIAAGRYTTSVNPADGSRVVIDLAQNGAQVGPPIPPPQTPSKDVAPKIDVEPGVGGEGLTKGAINTISDALGFGLPFRDAAKASSALTKLQVITQTTLQDAVPGKPSNYLLEKLDKLTVTPKSLMQGEERAQINLQDTRDLIAESLQTIDAYLAQPLRPVTKQKWDLKRRQLNQLKNRYDEILKGFGGGGEPQADAPKVSPEREAELLKKYGGQ